MKQRDRVTLVASGVAIAAAVLAVGGAPRWSLAVIAAPALIAVGAQLTSRRGMSRAQPLLVVLGIALGLTVLQAIPLPSAAQATLNPTSHNLIEEGHALLGDKPAALMPLSLDPPGTRRDALDLALAFTLAWVLLRLSTSSTGRYWILAGVAGTCGAAAAVGVFEQLLGGTALYGLYTPHHAVPIVLGPLLNVNTYGSLLVLGAMVSAGLALYTEHSAPRRFLWAANVVLCLVVTFETLSRGAALAAAIGAVTTGALWASNRRQRQHRRERTRPHLLRVGIPVTIVVLCGLAMLVLTSAGGVTSQLENTSVGELTDPMSKFAAWQSSEQLIDESPWIGVGRGGFEVAFTRVHPESAFGTFSHVENEYLQAVIDWGIPGAIAIAIGLGWLALLALRRRSDGPLAAGAIGGLVAVAAQSTVDFGLELPGLLIPVVAVVATLTYSPLLDMGTARIRRAFAERAGMIAMIVALVVIVVPPWGTSLAEDHDDLDAQDEPDLDDAHAAMRRHPLDYLAPARAALALFRVGDPTAMKHLNRALELHPTHTGLHRLAGRILAATGHPAQAKLEMQTAMRYTSTTDPIKLVGEILAIFPNVDDATGALWLDFPRPDVLARALEEWNRFDVAIKYLRLVSARASVTTDTLDLLVRTAIANGDLEAAEGGARLRLQREPDIKSRVMLGLVLRQRSKLHDAEDVLRPVPTLPGAPNEVAKGWLLLCDVELGNQEWQVAEDCLHALMLSPRLPVGLMREVHVRLAATAEGLGDKRRAAMERAYVQALP